VGAVAALLAIAAHPGAGRAQVACTGPVSGPTAYCPDCIYDTYGEVDPAKVRDDFACGQWIVVRPLGAVAVGRSDQYADPFLVRGGDYLLESVMVRLRFPVLDPPAVAGDVVVRVWDDDDVLGNDDPEDPGSFADNRPGSVLARAVIPEEVVACIGNQLPPLDPADRCDETADFDETPLLQDGVTYWVGAAMNDAGTRMNWAKTTGETAGDPCTPEKPNCSDEWVVAQTNADAPAWSPASNLDPVGLVRLLPEPSASALRAGAAGALLAAWTVRRRRRAGSGSVG
jgi:hypothetical protein